MCHHHGEFDWEAMREEIAEAEADDGSAGLDEEIERDADADAEEADERPTTIPTADD